MPTPDQPAQTASPPQNSQPTAATAATPPVSAPDSLRATAQGHSVVRIAGITLAVALGAVAVLFGCRWGHYRWTHSITEDAFIEAHIVNIAPQAVSGHLIRYLV